MFGDIAQLVERWTVNPQVGGSNPSVPANQTVPYGVMVAQEVLVLLVSVRIRVGQQVFMEISSVGRAQD